MKLHIMIRNFFRYVQLLYKNIGYLGFFIYYAGWIIGIKWYWKITSLLIRESPDAERERKYLESVIGYDWSMEDINGI